MLPKVSVTVPVYNTSRYLKRCIESLSLQTLKEIEFILVDDGSNDGSGEICDQYAQKDSRFKIIHQSNGGLSKARQTGLNNAKGEYVIVCDSDDWVEPEIYEKLYNAANDNNADISVCGYISEYDNRQSIPSQIVFKENNGIVDNFDFIARGAGSSWIKLVKRDLFVKTGTLYEPGINMSEDSLLVYKLCKGNPKVVQIEDHLYHYRREYGGQSYTNNLKMAHIHQLYFTYNWLKNNYKGDIYKRIVYKRAIDLAFACLRVNNLDKSFLSKFMKEELPWNKILSNQPNIKTLMIIIEKCLPLSIAQAIVKHLYRLVYK